jgi:dimethylargininase
VAATLHALTRAVSDAMDRCELTHLARSEIDVARARRQHAAYCDLLRELGCTMVEIPAAPELPDAIFVEDTVAVFDELAIILRPGAATRRAETDAVAAVLRRFRPLEFMTAPATLDGGDVLRIGRRVYIGRTTRSNDAGIRELARCVEPYGYDVTPVDVNGCLHLKSAVTAIGDGTLLINDAWVDRRQWTRYECVTVAAQEPHGANALALAGKVVLPASCVATRARIEAAGFEVMPIEVSEVAKAEGGVTCCSIIFEAEPVRL